MGHLHFFLQNLYLFVVVVVYAVLGWGWGTGEYMWCSCRSYYFMPCIYCITSVNLREAKVILNYFLDGKYKSRQGDNHFSGRGEGAASGVGRVEEKVYGV